MPENSQHYIKIMEAASPYLNSNMQKQINLLLKADELINSMNTSPSEFSALEMPAGSQPNVENMLEHILPVCNPGERLMINRMLNTIRAGRLFRNYQEFQNHSAGGATPHFQDFLMAQLTPEQQETLKTFQTILSN